MSRLDFVIVGTPRSGTTLVQRLAGELQGVRTPPETHFLTAASYGRLRAREFPLAGDRLTRRLEELSERHRADGLTVDVAAVAERVGGCATSVFELFDAFATEMAGPAEITGEKTPEHLVWWRPLTRALPHLKVIAIVREPDAVVASNLAVPFGSRHVELLAQRWVLDQDEIVAARSALGADRLLVLRYDVVAADLDAARANIARFLGVRSMPELSADAPVIHVEREWWKDDVHSPADDRGPSPDPLTPEDVAIVHALCRRHLVSFGFGAAPRRAATLATLARLSPGAWGRLGHFRLARWRRQRAIAAFGVTAPRPRADTRR